MESLSGIEIANRQVNRGGCLANVRLDNESVRAFPAGLNCRHEKSDLTIDHAKKMKAVIGPMVNYLMRLQQRTDQIGFEPTDPFHLSVKKAKESVYSLSIDLHYMSCVSGVASLGDSRTMLPELKEIFDTMRPLPHNGFGATDVSARHYGIVEEAIRAVLGDGEEFDPNNLPANIAPYRGLIGRIVEWSRGTTNRLSEQDLAKIAELERLLKECLKARRRCGDRYGAPTSRYIAAGKAARCIGGGLNCHENRCQNTIWQPFGVESDE